MRLITLAIHTYERALAVQRLLDAEGIKATLQNVNLESPQVASGVRVRINEDDLPLALRIVENEDIFRQHSHAADACHETVVAVPTDFSDHAFNAACVAARLAGSHGARLHFLHSFIGARFTDNIQLSDSLTYEVRETKDMQELTDLADANMRQLTERLREKMKSGELPVVKFTYNIVEGVPEDSIVEYSKTSQPYLIVMGTRSFSRKEREMIGSVTAEVLDQTRCSVLTVPEGSDKFNFAIPRSVLFFSNLDQEDILAIDSLYRFYPDASIKVTIVHVPRSSRFTDRVAGQSAMALSDYCSRKFTHFTFETVPLTPKTALKELRHLRDEHAFDMIVIPNRRKNAFSRMFNPGLAHKILFQADIPMLVIPV